jgi:hypothetical protein
VFFPLVVLFSIVQAETVLTGFPNRSGQFSPVGCREEFLSEKVSVMIWLFLFKGEVLLVFFDDYAR